MVSDPAHDPVPGLSDRPGQELPLVSVVVPVLDAAEPIAACLEGLGRQTYPSHSTEVIVVDNGSRDATRDVVRRYPVTLLVEDATRSPYAARNAGLAAAHGEVVALTDASCVPAADWVEQGVRALADLDADLAGGEVRFVLSARPSIGEIADAVLNVDVAASIEAHRACMTGNLFVRRRVLDTVGPFDPAIRSGGDMCWTRRATDAGLRLAYAPAAVVSYPARPLGPLLRKQCRVGRGTPGVWRAFGMSHGQMAASVARGLLPMPPLRLAERVRVRAAAVGRGGLVGAWLTVWLAKAVRTAGSVQGLLGG